MTDAATALNQWREKIAAAATAAGRSPESVRLIPASKSVPPERLRDFFDAGQKVFGENRIQEARAKIPLLPSSCRWHFIGGLQRNKVRDAVAWFDLIHSVDSLALLEEIDHKARAAGKIQQVLIEVNVAGESSKHGCRPEEAGTLIARAQNLAAVEVLGLMTVAPYHEDPELARPSFAQLRRLRDQLEAEQGWRLPELSMGMTHDYAVAIAEGATMVRIGSGLFGTRPPLPARA
jgi:pyridoxal phosphate enzyme (YggS family)